jgi:hypothetical protein
MLDAINGFEPTDEYAAGVHLILLANLVQVTVLTSPNAEPVEQSAGE